MLPALPPNRLYTTHESLTVQGTNRNLSPALWKHIGGSGMSPDGYENGHMFCDDFMGFYPVTVTTAAGQLQPNNGYFAYIEADATVGSILPVATEVGGVIRFLTSTDAGDGDDHDTTLTSGGNVAGLAKIDVTNGKRFIFEARARFTSVTDGDGSIFIGLGEEGLAAANTPQAAATHALSSDDLIGFQILETDNNALTFKYRVNGQTAVSVLTYGTALTAATWYKMGFVYDPSQPASKHLRVFIDNAELSTAVTKTATEAATFPGGEELALLASIKGSAVNDPQSFDLDWWAVWQED